MDKKNSSKYVDNENLYMLLLLRIKDILIKRKLNGNMGERFIQVKTSVETYKFFYAYISNSRIINKR